MKIRYIIVLLVIAIQACKSDVTISNDYSADKSDIKAHHLVDPKTVNQWLLEKPGFYIPVQVSKHKTFSIEHIPNAKNIWRPDYGSDIKEPYAGLIPSKEKLQSLLQTLGYTAEKKLILYDAKANVDALRFSWVLSLYGFDNYYIINGGLKFWKEQGLPVTKDPQLEAPKSSYQLTGNFNHSIIANFEEVREAIKDTNTILIDTREHYEYLGQPFIHNGEVLPFKKGAFNRGSIPSAIHLNWSTLADLNGDHRIKSKKDLNYDLAQKGISSEKNIILYCHSGSRTSHTYYVLKHILGYPNVKNYDGSWIEWSYKHSKDDQIPIQQLVTHEEFEKLQKSLIEK